LIDKFSIERVHSGGAKFDYEKAKWFNHEWIKQSAVDNLRSTVKNHLDEKGIKGIEDQILDKVIVLVRDRCALLTDFYDQSYFFFKAPGKWDIDAVKPKWNEEKKNFFNVLISKLANTQMWEVSQLETLFKDIALELKIKPGELQLPFRIMLVGGKFGPPVFNIAEILGKEETISRIKKALTVF